MRKSAAALLLGVAGYAVASCGGSDKNQTTPANGGQSVTTGGNPSTSGGALASGGASQSGSTSGGASAIGGASQGGVANGGSPADGGTSTGGTASGGSPADGGTSTGGMASGGSPADGGTSTGGVAGAAAGSPADGGTSQGGSAAAGTAGNAGASSGGGAGAPFACGHADASVAFDDGGLTRIGYTDPARSVALADGGHYVMPNTKYKGNCFTYTDAGGSSIYPPCGTEGDGGYRPCFTAASGLCVSASLGPGAASTWGGGFGCNLNQGTAAGAFALNTDIVGITSITIGVYGCSVPAELQVQLNVTNPPSDDAGIPGSGYFCNRATLGAPDANGVQSATIQLTDLVQDCWLYIDAGRGGLALDPSSMNVKSIQVQINAPEGVPSDWDFCVSRLSID
jgi:hypothetical protein